MFRVRCRTGGFPELLPLANIQSWKVYETNTSSSPMDRKRKIPLANLEECREVLPERRDTPSLRQQTLVSQTQVSPRLHNVRSSKAGPRTNPKPTNFTFRLLVLVASIIPCASAGTKENNRQQLVIPEDVETTFQAHRQSPMGGSVA